ncbi:MAG: M61 family metallopeptidase [Pyrinomonadaceae bacterium]|nr:M61 family metallopeptidase [Pyrinomonadaceae bacterium]
MRNARLQAAFVLAAILFFFTAVEARAQDSRNGAQPDISYTVSMSKPYTHLLEVEMRVRSSRLPANADLVMPVWTPGSYLVREYARHVQDFAAKDAGGRTLAWRKSSKNTWRVETGGAKEIVVVYSVCANELTVRTNELNDEHAFWTNAALLMYPAGQLKSPSTLRIVPFGEWKIATGLAAVAGQPNTFRAETYDALYDSPVEVGNFKTLSFEVKNVSHRIVINGEGNYDGERMRRDVQKIVETTVEMFGGEFPYRDYTFILNLRMAGSGGLEHTNSTALIWRRFGFRPESSYIDFLSLVAHEYYHVWNVKLIRPDALGPFDYTQENYTRLLWVAEGLTDYYEDLILRRSSLMSDRQFLNVFAVAIQDLQNRPGRFETSVEEASFDAWIKFYRPDENAVNNQISYYDKGGIVGMLLDLEIRRVSKGERSLDDTMRYLYAEFSKKGRNYTPEDFQRAAERAAGASLDSFFSKYVRGRDEIDYDAILAAFGLRLDTTGATASTTPPAERAFFGATLAQVNDRLMVRNVREGTPAYDQGIMFDDQIVALDGMRVGLETWDARLSEKRPGDKIRVTVFRRDDLRTIEITLGGRIVAPYAIVPVAQPTEDQQRLYQAWMGAPLKKQ